MSGPSSVITTNDDASNAKRSATHRGYWYDNYIQYFVKSLPERKTPEIHRGYYIRYKCIRTLVDKFIAKCDRKCQIVSIGAGFDTLYWNLHETDNLPKYGIYEFDLKEVVEKKSFFVSTRHPLQKCLRGNVEITKERIESESYHLFTGDICCISDIDKRLVSAGIKKDIPTLFLAECVLVYIPLDVTNTLLQYISDEYRTVMLVDYDPISLNDRFGDVMKNHLRGRNCSLLGAQPDLNSKKSFYDMFSCVNGKLLIDAYHELPGNEKTRVEKIEFLDEVNLLYDLLRHYSIMWSSNDPDNIGLKSVSIF